MPEAPRSRWNAISLLATVGLLCVIFVAVRVWGNRKLQTEINRLEQLKAKKDVIGLILFAKAPKENPKLRMLALTNASEILTSGSWKPREGEANEAAGLCLEMLEETHRDEAELSAPQHGALYYCLITYGTCILARLTNQALPDPDMERDKYPAFWRELAQNWKSSKVQEPIEDRK